MYGMSAAMTAAPKKKVVLSEVVVAMSPPNAAPIGNAPYAITLKPAITRPSNSSGVTDCRYVTDATFQTCFVPTQGKTYRSTNLP